MPDIRSEDREVQQYRTPPYSKEAEDGVLGALLIDNNTFDLIGGKSIRRTSMTTETA